MTKTEREANRLRQQAFVQRMTDAGFKVLRGLWVHASDAERVKTYVQRLNYNRGTDPRKR